MRFLLGAPTVGKGSIGSPLCTATTIHVCVFIYIYIHMYVDMHTYIRTGH